jgi:hypothetical protein
MQTLKRCRPVVIFEFGMGAADFYGSRPDELYALVFHECGLKISTLDGFLHDAPHLTGEQFRIMFEKGLEYYFVAYP